MAFYPSNSGTSLNQGQSQGGGLMPVGTAPNLPAPLTQAQGLQNQYLNAFGATSSQFLPQLQNSNQLSGLLDSGATLYGQMAGAQSQAAHNTYDTSLQSLGIQKAANLRQLGVQSQLQGLANQGFGIQTTAANQQADIAQRNLMSQAAANGSVQTLGTHQGLGDIHNQLANQLGQIGIQQQTSQVNTQEAEAQLKDTAKQYGVDETTLHNSLDSALRSLGLQGSISVNQLMAQQKYLKGNDYALFHQWVDAALSVSSFMSKTLGGAPSTAKP